MTPRQSAELDDANQAEQQHDRGTEPRSEQDVDAEGQPPVRAEEGRVHSAREVEGTGLGADESIFASPWTLLSTPSSLTDRCRIFTRWFYPSWAPGGQAERRHVGLRHRRRARRARAAGVGQVRPPDRSGCHSTSTKVRSSGSGRPAR